LSAIAIALGLQNSLEAIGCNWVAVTPEINDWYQHPDIEGAIEAINKALYGEQPVTLGASMGGLAAWTLSGELNACGWAVFGANYNMTTDVKWDHRLMAERRTVEATHGWRALQGAAAGGRVWFDPLNRIDSAHANRIALVTGASVRPRPNDGHNLLGTWSASGQLREHLHQSVNEIAHINLPVAA